MGVVKKTLAYKSKSGARNIYIHVYMNMYTCIYMIIYVCVLMYINMFMYM